MAPDVCLECDLCGYLEGGTRATVMAYLDFDLHALYEALDSERVARNMTWAAVAREICGRAALRDLSASTITGLRTNRLAEGDGVLQMLRWLGRSPESFVPDLNASPEQTRLPAIRPEQILRWDARALYAAVQEQKENRKLSWPEVADEIGGCTPGILTHLAKGGRVGFPRVMRIVLWLGRPAASFMRGCDA